MTFSNIICLALLFSSFSTVCLRCEFVLFSEIGLGCLSEFQVFLQFWSILSHYLSFPGGSVVKNPLAKQETQFQSLGQKDALEKEMATHPSIPAWEIPWTEEPGGLQSMGLERVIHDWTSEHKPTSFSSQRHREEIVLRTFFHRGQMFLPNSRKISSCLGDTFEDIRLAVAMEWQIIIPSQVL